MRYLTDRKRAEYRGSARSGTHHHLMMQMSAIALALLVPSFLFILGSAIGGSRAEVVATFARPFPAIITGLLLVVGARHFAAGATMMFEDYTRGTARKLWVFGAHALAWTIAATGLLALVKIAL